MKTVAYLRVSTGGQDINSQRLVILDYAHRHRMHVDDFVEVTVSSRKTLKERGIEGLCAGMQAGDLMLVSELSRLGRSVAQIIQIVDSLVKNHIRFVAIKNMACYSFTKESLRLPFLARCNGMVIFCTVDLGRRISEV